MIRYALKCAEGHGFESWFANGEAFEKLAKAGHLSCPVCGAAKVEKALMAPALSTATTPSAPAANESESESDVDILARKIEALRREVEANSDYVGLEFARKARAMHLGEEPRRAIHGEARIDEARALLDEGIAVAPLPFVPRARSN